MRRIYAGRDVTQNVASPRRTRTNRPKVVHTIREEHNPQDDAAGCRKRVIQMLLVTTGTQVTLPIETLLGDVGEYKIHPITLFVTTGTMTERTMQQIKSQALKVRGSEEKSERENARTWNELMNELGTNGIRHHLRVT